MVSINNTLVYLRWALCRENFLFRSGSQKMELAMEAPSQMFFFSPNELDLIGDFSRGHFSAAHQHQHSWQASLALRLQDRIFNLFYSIYGGCLSQREYLKEKRSPSNCRASLAIKPEPNSCANGERERGERWEERWDVGVKACK